ncbi:MAG: helix-turn-helix domain-containing protein [Pseudonocardiaceae bacterium]
MSALGDWCCPSCGAGLRRTRAEAGECDPCRRAAPALTLDPALWDEPALSAALARLDFGPVFLRVRAETGWSQHRLGEVLSIDQSTLSKIEKGKRSLTDAASVIRCANALAIPAGKLGLRHGVMVESRVVTGREGSWVDRRGFVGEVAGLTLGAAGLTGLDLDRLIALLPQAEPTGTRHVGTTDVEAIEAATAAFKCQDFAQGSGMAWDTAVARLRVTLPLLGAQMAPEVRPRLYLATAHLALQVGYMSFDVNHDDGARRLWMIGLDIARHTEDPRSSDLTAYLLYDMAIQAVSLGRPDEALKLVHLGHAAAIGSHPVSASTTSALSSIEARAHAAQGNTPACDRALSHAAEWLTTLDPATRPPWGAWISEASISGSQGRAYYALALASSDPRAASRAVPLLRHDVDQLGPDHARHQAVCLLTLAGAHALAGDIDTAVSVGHQAVDAVTAVRSPRAHGGLHRLRTVLEPCHTSPGVAELRERLTTTA